MGDFRMPALGADMTEGTLLEWYVAPGAVVHRGDVVALVDTAKAEIEVEVFEDGVVEELLVDPGTRVPVGTVLARIGAVPAEAAAPPAATPPAVAAPPPTVAPLPAAAPPPAAAAPPPPRPLPAAARADRIHASPVARRAASVLGVDLATVHGSGPHGAITRADVEAAAAPAPAAPAPAPAPQIAPTPPADRAARMRQAIAHAMERSAREIPQYHLALDIDLSATIAWVQAANRGRGPATRLVGGAVLLAAAARAAARFPEFNGYWIDGEHHPRDRVHVGMAISLREGGLMTPAIHDADQRTPDELMAALRDLVKRTRSGGLRGSELTDATITVTSIGDQGAADVVHGVIYPPQVALVGFGVVRQRPWARDGMVGPRPVVTATLAADHRASDGARGARFLEAVEHMLQTPEDL